MSTVPPAASAEAKRLLDHATAPQKLPCNSSQRRAAILPPHLLDATSAFHGRHAQPRLQRQRRPPRACPVASSAATALAPPPRPSNDRIRSDVPRGRRRGRFHGGDVFHGRRVDSPVVAGRRSVTCPRPSHGGAVDPGRPAASSTAAPPHSPSRPPPPPPRSLSQ